MKEKSNRNRRWLAGTPRGPKDETNCSGRQAERRLRNTSGYLLQDSFFARADAPAARRKENEIKRGNDPNAEMEQNR